MSGMPGGNTKARCVGREDAEVGTAVVGSSACATMANTD